MTDVLPARDALPFSAERLDALLDHHGLDAIIINSKHNIQYLTGGYRFYFMEYMDAIGTSRYLPLLVYVKGRRDEALYVGNNNEVTAIGAFDETALKPFWIEARTLNCWGTIDAMDRAVGHLLKCGLDKARIGIETAFLPADAYLHLVRSLPHAEVKDCLVPLERLRALKQPWELERLRLASELVVESMLAATAQLHPEMTTRELADLVRLEEQKRGLTFEYCMVSAGTSYERAPSSALCEPNHPISIDSGGNHRGFIGDVCRMAILGKPDSELEDLLSDIEEVQQMTRKLVQVGARGGDICTAGEEAVRRSRHAGYTNFLAHGMGLISHEAPRLTSRSPLKYDGLDEDEPLQKGIVISIETTMKHPKRGFIKLEDTVAITDKGTESFGDWGRGWNVAGSL